MMADRSGRMWFGTGVYRYDDLSAKNRSTPADAGTLAAPQYGPEQAAQQPSAADEPTYVRELQKDLVLPRSRLRRWAFARGR